MSDLTGFLEESPGVRSMTRLAVLLASLGVLVLTLALAAYLLAAKPLTDAPPDSGVIAALGVPLVALAGGVWAALRERTGGEP